MCRVSPALGFHAERSVVEWALFLRLVFHFRTSSPLVSVLGRAYGCWSDIRSGELLLLRLLCVHRARPLRYGRRPVQPWSSALARRVPLHRVSFLRVPLHGHPSTLRYLACFGSPPTSSISSGSVLAAPRQCRGRPGSAARAMLSGLVDDPQLKYVEGSFNQILNIYISAIPAVLLISTHPLAHPLSMRWKWRFVQSHSNLEHGRGSRVWSQKIL